MTLQTSDYNSTFDTVTLQYYIHKYQLFESTADVCMGGWRWSNGQTCGKALFIVEWQMYYMLRCCFLTPLDGHPLQPLSVESIEIQPVKL